MPSTRYLPSVGQILRWSGEAIRLDGAGSRLLTASEEVRCEWRDRVPHAAARLARTRGEARPARLAEEPDRNGLLLGDGRTSWRADILRTLDGGAFLLFESGLAPADRDLRVLRVPVARRPAATSGTVCFTPGTTILAEDGPRLVETLLPGDRVLTRDDGPQDIRWMGRQSLSAATLDARPALRPVRLRAGALGPEGPQPDLVVSPDHRVMLGGPRARGLWGEPEILVRAGDLIDDARVIRDHAIPDVTYIHLLFARHQVIRANGVEVESFHPADADLARLDPAERRDLLRVAPEIDVDASAYGPHARRCLTAAELALMRHDGVPAHLA